MELKDLILFARCIFFGGGPCSLGAIVIFSGKQLSHFLLGKLGPRFVSVPCFQGGLGLDMTRLPSPLEASWVRGREGSSTTAPSAGDFFAQGAQRRVGLPRHRRHCGRSQEVRPRDGGEAGYAGAAQLQIGCPLLMLLGGIDPFCIYGDPSNWKGPPDQIDVDMTVT